MKPIWKYPPPSPSSGINRHGPILRNLVIPKDAVNMEEKNVKKKVKRFLITSA